MKISLFLLLLKISILLNPAQAENISLDELLTSVKQGLHLDLKENAARIEAFKKNKRQQQKQLADIKAVQQSEEQRSQALEKQFEANEQLRKQLTEKLQQRMGSLKELFGVLQQVANDSRGQFNDSLTQIQFAQRDKFLEQFSSKMGTTTELPDIQEIEKLWFELQREMTESGKVVSFTTPITDKQGIEKKLSLVRVGLFNLVAAGHYYQYIPETGRVIEYPRQPDPRHLQGAAQLSDKNNNSITPFSLDPSRGQLLSLLVQAPDWLERIEQGGVIAHIILGLGALALLIALERLLALTITGWRLSLQTRRIDRPGSNALGRIIKLYQKNIHLDNETLELKLAEQVLKETLRINRRIGFIKIIAVISPLLGLLGTVTGMIITFQAITLFGTGDPKLMSGGISQALVTTVLGLAIAIPAILLHAMTQGRAKGISEILEQQTMGLIAAQAEANTKQTSSSLSNNNKPPTALTD